MRRIALLAAVGMTLIGASIAMGLGGASKAKIRSSHHSALSEHRVAAPSGGTAMPTSKRRLHRARLIYLETNTFTLRSGKTDGATGKCPRRSKAINGYFGSNGDRVVPIEDTVENSTRVWGTFIHNFGPDARVFVGTVCLKP
jgi:hypothetical protein